MDKIDSKSVYKFKSNIDMHHFIVMAPEIKNEFYFNTSTLDEAAELVLPYYVSKGATITPC